MPIARLLVVLALGMLAGCGGEDPTAPRATRTIEPIGSAPDSVAKQRDDGAPTRGIPCDAQHGSLRLCGAATDNYKASYNADPDAPERRSWLAIHELDVNGARYELVGGQDLLPATVSMRPVNGGAPIEVRARVIEGPATVDLRVGPQRGLWGPLLTLDDAQVDAKHPITVELRVAGDTRVAARVRYVRDERLATAPKDSLEHGGPGGRWYLEDLPTGTNLELGWE